MIGFVRRCRSAFAIFFILLLVLLPACSDNRGLPSAAGTTTPSMPSATPVSTPQPSELPQIDSSTARKPITAAIYELFTGTYG